MPLRLRKALYEKNNKKNVSPPRLVGGASSRQLRFDDDIPET